MATAGEREVTTSRSGFARTGYLAMTSIDAIGSGLFLPIAALSLSVLMQVPPQHTGVIVTLGTVAGLALGMFGGPLMQRVSAGSLLLVSLLIRGAATLGYVVLNGLSPALAVTAGRRIGSSLGRPAFMVLASQLATEDQQVTLLAHSLVWRNIATGVGAGLAALLVVGAGEGAYIALVVANAGSYLLAAVLARILARSSGTADDGPARPKAEEQSISVRDLLRDIVFVRVAVSTAFLSTQAALLAVALPLWLLVEVGGRKAGLYASAAIVLNTILVACFQVRVSRGAREPRQAVRMLRISGGLFAGACTVLACAAAILPLIPSLVVAIVLITVAEMLMSAGGWGASLGFAPAGQPEQHVGAISWAQSVGEALSAGTVGTLAVTFGTWGWGLAALIFVVPVVLLPLGGNLRLRAGR